MKTYRKTATVKAKMFEPGDEDGTSCLPFVYTCSYEDENGKYKQCHKCPLPIQKQPYVDTLEGKIYGDFNKHYVCSGINNERWLVEKNIFEKTYEE